MKQRSFGKLDVEQVFPPPEFWVSEGSSRGSNAKLFGITELALLIRYCDSHEAHSCDGYNISSLSTSTSFGRESCLDESVASVRSLLTPDVAWRCRMLVVPIVVCV